ncbi:MAG TPA: hypothetical protein VLJ37_03475 [bacterium]|nr:hypothetical protein [bacterium]
MKSLLRLSSFGLFAAWLAAAFAGGVSGCNTDEIAGHGSDDNVVGTEQDAKDTATAAENVAFRAFTASFGTPGSALDLGLNAGLILGKLKDAIEANSRSSCAAGDVPSPSGDNVTVNGGVGGTCAVKFEGDASDGILRANCTRYDDGVDSGEAAVDGLIGVSGSAATVGNESTFTFSSITSNLLVMTLADGDNCSAVLNLSADVTINNDNGTGSVSMDGCVSICGEAFDVTGSETF